MGKPVAGSDRVGYPKASESEVTAFTYSLAFAAIT